MKAVIVCNDEEMIDKVSAVLHSAGYEIIAYRWLLKALDNFVEISPHLVVISTKDYPRHWKTFIQYARSGITRVIPEFILYTNGQLGQDEESKARILRIRGSFSGIDVDGLDTLRGILRKENDIYSGSVPERMEQTELSAFRDALAEKDGAAMAADAAAQAAAILAGQKDELSRADRNSVAVSADDLVGMKYVDMAALPRDNHKNVGFMFTDPADGAFITGAVEHFSGTSFDFIPHRAACLSHISVGQRIADCTLIADGEIRHTAVFAESVSDRIRLTLGE